MYMGRDKYENEDLIKYAQAEDFWFHVDDLSSAHVYLKPQDNWTLDSIPKDVLEDCAQLVKANSIEGNKLNNIKVVYTPASNLRKENGFAPGQVAFHNKKLLRFITVERRTNEIVNRLNKTKREVSVDYEAEQRARIVAQRESARREKEAARIAEQLERKKLQEEAEMRSYHSVFSKMDTDDAVKGSSSNLEEDFF